jgi:hypothetical protein
MVKVRDPLLGAAAPQRIRQQHQVIIVHPDDVCFVFYRADNRRELRVYPAITLPILRIEPASRRETVEQRPENFV